MRHLIIFIIFFLVPNSFAQLPSNSLDLKELLKALLSLRIQNQKLIREIDSIKIELKINRALMDADQKRAMDTLEYSSKIVDLSGWIMTFLGVAFLIIGYFGFREVKSFRMIRKRMNNSLTIFKTEMDEFRKISKNLVNIMYWSNEGWDKYTSGNYERESYLFKKIKEIKSDDYETCYRLGKVYSAMRKYEEANSEFEEAIKIDPLNGDAYFGLGWNFKNERKYEEAIEAYQKGLKLTYDFYGLCGLGHVYMESMNLKEAKKCFIDSWEEKPNSGSSFPLANIFLFESNQEEACKYYNKTIDITNDEMIEMPDYFWAYYNKVGAEIGLNKTDYAKNSIEIALSKNAGLEILKNMLFHFEFMKKTNKVSNEIDYFIDKLNEKIKLNLTLTVEKKAFLKNKKLSLQKNLLALHFVL